MTAESSTRNAPRKWSPILCGALWGLGIGASIVGFLLLRGTSVYDSMAVLFFGAPIICAFAGVIGILIYRRLARVYTPLGSRYALIPALLAVVVLWAIPEAEQYARLRVFAGMEIASYPVSDNRSTTIHVGPAARIEVEMHSTAALNDVMTFYEESWRKKGWTTYRDDTHVSATRPGQTMYVFLFQPKGEIEISWYKNFSNH